MIDDVDHQTHESIDEVFPGLGLARQAFVNEFAI
jgi:hypothetical protein